MDESPGMGKAGSFGAVRISTSGAPTTALSPEPRKVSANPLTT